jgi:hypothetical protein
MNWNGEWGNEARFLSEDEAETQERTANDDGPWVMISLKIIEKNEVNTREKLLG